MNNQPQNVETNKRTGTIDQTERNETNVLINVNEKTLFSSMRWKRYRNVKMQWNKKRYNMMNNEQPNNNNVQSTTTNNNNK